MSMTWSNVMPGVILRILSLFTLSGKPGEKNSAVKRIARGSPTIKKMPNDIIFIEVRKQLSGRNEYKRELVPVAIYSKPSAHLFPGTIQ